MTVYVSHWDAGVLRLDISDPARPRMIGRTTFDITEDGDAHSAAIYEANGTRYILQNNEEVSPLSPPVITSSATGVRQMPAIKNHFMPTPLSSIGVTTGEVFDANDACEESDFDGAAGKIALFDTGDEVACDIGGQVVRAIRSTARGFLINFLGTSRPTFFRLFPDPESAQIIFSEGEGIPSAMFSQIDGGAAAMRAQLATGPVTVTTDARHQKLQPYRDTLSHLIHDVSSLGMAYTPRCAEALDADDRGASPRSARRDPGHDGSAGSRAWVALGDDVADR